MSKTGFLSGLAAFSVLVAGLASSHVQAQSRVLTWPGKAQSPAPVPAYQETPAPVRLNPVVEAQTRPSDPVTRSAEPELRYNPVPVSAPVSMPVSVPVATPQALPPIRTTPLPSGHGQTPPPVAKVPAAPQAARAPAPAPVTAPATDKASKPASGPSAGPAAPTDTPYQIPATSKYAGRVAAPTAPVQISGQNPLEANAQALAQQMPSQAPGVPQASGNGFVPGQQVTNPESQRPRFYSLHRQYGLVPDPTPHTATPDPRSSVSKE